jgi:UDP-N-acetylglucosamine--N-acetylmuramyl-(pentapeptide) pyrophosphoryl-undecaprenol N-acetylglucosamine transferase
VLPEAFAGAKERIATLSVTHQTGQGRDQQVHQRYADLGASAWVNVVPFIDDVAGALGSADLVVQRAGASVAELCGVGRPAILIPYPFAADDHQKKNGDALALLGAAVCIEQKDATKERIRDELVALAVDPDRRRSMAEAAAQHGRPDAARAIARDLLALAGVPLREEKGRV